MEAFTLRHVGFTGTSRRELTPQQEVGVTNVLSCYADNWIHALHHGDCVGADAHVHRIGRRFEMWLELHPTFGARRAYCASERDFGVTIHEPLPPIVRNHVIVDRCELLVAAPFDEKEELRSGTWATVRYARRVGKPIVIVHADGHIVLNGDLARVLYSRPVVT